MAAIPHSSHAETFENVEYGRAGELSLRLDAYVPPGPGPFPAVVIVHGGAWVSGDRKYSVRPLFKPLADAGFAWFSISYRLARDVKPGSLDGNGILAAMMQGAAIDDVRTAVKFVRTHAAQYRVDPNRIALLGESAGAQLASMAALRPSAGSEVQAVVAFYSPSDLADLARTSQQVPPEIRRAVKGTPFEKILLAGLANLSPVTFVSKDAPPFLLIHGTEDTIVPYRQSVAMCDRLREAGGSCDLFPVPGEGHGILWWESDRDTRYKSVLVNWLRKRLMPARGATS